MGQFCMLINNEKLLKEFDDHLFITNHPYAPLQKARLLKEGIRKFYQRDEKILTQVERLYEEAIESIEFDYRYLYGTKPHASLLMFFGVFLCQQLNAEGRAIRFLEDSKKFYGSNRHKGWFITCNYLTKAYKNKYQETNDNAYKDQLIKVVREVIKNDTGSKKSEFDISQYKKLYSKWIQ